LELVRSAVDEEGRPVLTCLCDCGTVTDVTLADLPLTHGLVQELAYVCDGCESPHWITIAVSEEQPPAAAPAPDRPAGFTCPRCGATSYHPTDLEEGYCGRCHDWTGAERRPLGS
jgi:transcription initiation factor IIE alpha subunit